MIKKLLLFLFAFIFVFSIEFIFLPIRFRWFLALLGTVCFMSDYKIIVKCLTPTMFWKKLFRLLIILLFVAFLSTIINGHFDRYFFKYPISIYLSLSSAYAFLFLIRRFFNVDFSHDDYCKLLLHLCVAQIIISLIGFLYPSFLNSILSVLKSNALQDETIESVLFYEGSRIIGIGVSFFGAGALYATIITLSAIFIKKENNFLLRILYISEIIIIIMIGSAIARTTLIGIAGFMIILISGNGRNFVKNATKIFLLFGFIVIVAFLFYKRNLEGTEVFGLAFERAFSIFYTLQDSGELQSIDSMVGHSIWPNNIKTWIIGDGLMSDPNNPELGYYMNIDRGWNRIVFGIGIVGAIVYSLVQSSLCRLAFNKKEFARVMMVLYALFMVKGIYYMDASLSVFIIMNVFNGVQDTKCQMKQNILIRNENSPSTC